MKILFSFLLVFGALLGSARGDLIISEVYPNGSNAPYGSDWFELTNTGATAIDITGWKFDDSSDNPGLAAPLVNVTSIAAGQSVVFLEVSPLNYADRVVSFNQFWFGSDTSSVVIGSYNGSGLGLSTGGDAVNIYDASNALIANVSFGATTVGFTFDNAAGLTGPGPAGTITQLSAVGVNGAFASFNAPSEIGSPGTIAAIPEPTSVALAGLGMAGLMAWRRRRSS
jgi:hypothetical protein